MKPIIVLGICFLLGNPVQAQAPAAANRDANVIRSATLQAQTLEENIKKFEAAIRLADIELNEAQRAALAEGNGRRVDLRNVPAYQAALSRRNMVHENARKGIEESTKELNEVKDRITAAQATYVASNSAVTPQSLDNFEKLLKVEGLLGRFNKIEIKDLTLNAKLDRLTAAVDRSVMGQYMQDKIGQLLNSKSMCMAYDRCKVPTTTSIDPNFIRNELFKDAATGRDDYYEKVQGRKAEKNLGGTK